MNQLSTPAATAESPISATKDAFDRLTPLGWRWGLAAIIAGLAASFFLFGYALIYWRNADMDLVLIYNALALNDGKPQVFFDHPSYLTILSVEFWYRLLHALGLLDAWKLSAIPSAANVPAFDAAMTSAVRAGRLLALLIASTGVLIFAGLARAIRPVFSPFDGDVVFALSTGRQPLAEPHNLTLARIGALAADTLARAVARVVYAARSWSPDGPPCWRDLTD